MKNWDTGYIVFILFSTLSLGAPHNLFWWTRIKIFCQYETTNKSNKVKSNARTGTRNVMPCPQGLVRVTKQGAMYLGW